MIVRACMHNHRWATVWSGVAGADLLWFLLAPPTFYAPPATMSFGGAFRKRLPVRDPQEQTDVPNPGVRDGRGQIWQHGHQQVVAVVHASLQVEHPDRGRHCRHADSRHRLDRYL